MSAAGLISSKRLELVTIIEKRTGLLRPYVSRVENDHTTPAIETLEKWARALGIALYAIFYHGNNLAKPDVLPKQMQLLNSPGDMRFMKKLLRVLSRMQERNRRVLLDAARAMSQEQPQGSLARLYARP